MTAYHFLVAITSNVYSVYLEITVTGLHQIILLASNHWNSIFRMINEQSVITAVASAPKSVNKRDTTGAAMNTERIVNVSTASDAQREEFSLFCFLHCSVRNSVWERHEVRRQELYLKDAVSDEKQPREFSWK